MITAFRGSGTLMPGPGGRMLLKVMVSVGCVWNAIKPKKT